MKGLSVASFLIFVTCGVLNAEDRSAEGNAAALKLLDLQDCNIMRVFERVWKLHPLDERESAAWLVINVKGQYEEIDWPHSPGRRITTWSERLPRNIIAQLHTHGDHLDPKPSSQDVAVAQKLRIHIFTLTRKGIWRVAPDGQITQQADRGWFEKTIERCRED